jgi:hypothetical protein
VSKSDRFQTLFGVSKMTVFDRRQVSAPMRYINYVRRRQLFNDPLWRGGRLPLFFFRFHHFSKSMRYLDPIVVVQKANLFSASARIRSA